MKARYLLLTLLVLICLTSTTYAQNKYAILITGDYAAAKKKDVPHDDLWNGGIGENFDYDEFWNDTFLMWEMLQSQGYSQENIFVLFADGNDYHPDQYASRYKTDPNVKVTDYIANSEKLTFVLNGLKYGQNGFQKITNNDFLFVWVFDHGGAFGGHHGFYLLDGLFRDEQLAALVNPIEANKKVFWMQQCLSGGFKEELQANNVVFNAACLGNESAHRADNLPYDDENEIIGGKVYNHGEFNFHIYSSTNGATPTYSTTYGQGEINLSDADLNADNFISTYESYKWEFDNELRDDETPVYSDTSNIGLTTSLQYPTLLFDDILANKDYRGIIGISKDIHVPSGKVLKFNTKADVYLLNEAKIIVDLGGTLILSDSTKIHGNSIEVNGNLQIGNNVNFFENELFLNNINLEAHFYGALFDHSGLHSFISNLIIDQSTFETCYSLDSHFGNVSITNSTLTDTYVYLGNSTSNPDLVAKVTGCDIKNLIMNVGIDINNYGKYFIEYNSIQGKHKGIQISNSGNGVTGNQSIFGNNIHGSLEAGIQVYNTKGSIAGNYIHDNYIGLKLLNNCNIALFGNANAQTSSGTQRIINNSLYEIYASQYCFPWYFRYNVIVDEDNIGNPSDPMVFHDRPNVPPLLKLDVMYNYWGTNFDADQDLKTTNGVFKFIPFWLPGSGGVIPDPIDEMYTTALDRFKNGEYAEAKNLFQLLIHLYPNSDYALASMKELIGVESYLSSDYAELKQYYQTNDSILADSNLVNLSDILANVCNIKLENWPDAIGWYENIINNPKSVSDSIFAIIDLGYLYMLIENLGLKNQYVGAMHNLKPQSQELFFENRDYLLSKIPQKSISDNLHRNLTNLKCGQLLQNIPNPYSDRTQIWYKIEDRSDVTILVSNVYGNEVNKTNLGNKEQGTFLYDFYSRDLPSGTYFCSLYLNGNPTNTIKMIQIR